MSIPTDCCTLREIDDLLLKSDECVSQGRWDESSAATLEALQLSDERLGRDHSQTLDVKATLAYNYRQRGRYDESARLDREILATRRRILGREHGRTALTMSHLALDLKGLGQIEEALELETEALDIVIRVEGEDSRSSHVVMNNLANSYFYHHRLEDAAQLQETVLELRMRAAGRDHPETLSSMDMLGIIYRELGQLDRAVQIQQKALGFAMTTGPGESSETARKCMINLGTTYRRFFLAHNDGNGNHNGGRRATELLRRSVFILERAVELSRQTVGVGEDHPVTVCAMNELALAYVELDRMGDAKALFSAAWEWKEKTLGARHPDTKIARENLQRLLVVMGELPGSCL